MTPKNGPPARGDDLVAVGLATGRPDNGVERDSIVRHADALGARVAEIRSVNDWPALEEAVAGIVEILGAHRAGLLVVDGLRGFVVPGLDEHAIGHVLRWNAWSAGARLETCDGSDAIADGAPCPICGDVVPITPGIVGRLCQRCVHEAVDDQGHPVRFFNRSGGEGVRTVLWEDPDVELVDVDVRVRGRRCRAMSGRYGGIIVTTSSG